MTKQGGIKDEARGRQDIYRMDPYKVHKRDGWNVRDVDFDPLDIDDLSLANSIAEIGVKEPLTVVWADGKAWITNGHRRHAAAIYAIEKLGAELKEIPCQTEPRYSSEADHVLSMIVRNSGKALSPFEQGRVFKRLIDLGWSESEISRRVGKSRQWVVSLLDLQAAPEDVTKFVRSGEVSATTAIHAIRDADGNHEKAASDLSTAVETAKASGKTRATAKHVPARKLSLQEQIVSALATAKVIRLANGDFSIQMSADDFTQFLGLTGWKAESEQASDTEVAA